MLSKCPPRPHPQSTISPSNTPADAYNLSSVQSFETSDVREQRVAEVIHGRHGQERSAALAALVGLHDAHALTTKAQPVVSSRRLARYRDCGTRLHVYRRITPLRWDDDDDWALWGNWCKDRFCPTCAARRRKAIVRELHAAIDARYRADPANPPRLVTLTCRHTAQMPLTDAIARIKNAWRALTKTPWWKSTQVGGIWTMEIKRSARSRDWHVHLHAVVLATWISQRRLRDHWLAVTGDSHVVHVKPLRSDPAGGLDAAVGYVAAYVSKPAILSKMTPDDAEAVVVAAKSGRLWTCWGTLRAATAAIRKAEEVPFDRNDWMPIAPLSQVVVLALQGDPPSVWLLGRLGLSVAPPADHIGLPHCTTNEQLLHGPPQARPVPVHAVNDSPHLQARL